MDTPTLIDVRITYAYQNERDGLHTVSMPVMLVPACTHCFGCCDQQPCPVCAQFICSACVQEHACCCGCCGKLNAACCNHCNLPLCATCATLHDCKGSQCDYSSATSDGEPEVEPTGKVSDSAWPPRLRETPYIMLRELWAPRGVPMARIKKNMWLDVSCAPDLCRRWPEAHGHRRVFGEEMNDFALLCEALAWDFPQGAAVVHLEKKSTVVCGPGRAAHAAHVTSALSWLRSLRGQTFGIVLRRIGDRLQGAFLEVLFHPRLEKEETAKRRRTILNAVARLTTAKP
eukprot:9139390-Karenia_brevis.AAC.2